ncbi:hypothetical protein FS837_001237 [Tulasnella sp. UAMH 9824]|nr:hypothetical protein FS837_001237 [Tulasnella sp. UAMH 9824]
MLLPLVLVALPLHASSTSPPTVNLKGVAPARQHLYPAAGSTSATWQCLDGSKTIPVASINDDYCDCPDGSDEPGTSACPNGTFHCINAGHIGADIRSSRVGDGLCEPECCDGSDEAEGVCENRCEAIGSQYKAEQAAIQKARKTGAKIRSTYVAFAQKEKTRLEESIASLKKEVETKRAEADRTNDILSRLESLDNATLEIKKQSPLFTSLEKHNAAIKALHARSKRLQNEIDKLEGLLDDLESGYNPNYVDMAVINTVKAWKKMKGVVDEPAEGSTEGEQPAAENTATKEKDEEDDSPSEEDEEDAKWTEWEIKGLTERTDYVSLLLDHERHVGQSLDAGDQVKSILYSIEEYLPGALLPTYESGKAALLQVLQTLGIIPQSGHSAAETSSARQANNDAKNALSSAESRLRNEEGELSKLFDPRWYGSDGAWKKLENTCLSKDTGEYTYSVCLFKGATQKSNKDGSSNNLGNFGTWNKSPSLQPGDYEYYTMMHYERGAQCWNGPQRSVTLKLSCGTENELLSVSEPEKCEYHFVGKTPALCWPTESEEGKTFKAMAKETAGQREEL